MPFSWPIGQQLMRFGGTAADMFARCAPQRRAPLPSANAPCPRLCLGTHVRLGGSHGLDGSCLDAMVLLVAIVLFIFMDGLRAPAPRLRIALGLNIALFYAENFFRRLKRAFEKTAGRLSSTNLEAFFRAADQHNTALFGTPEQYYAARFPTAEQDYYAGLPP